MLPQAGKQISEGSSTGDSHPFCSLNDQDQAGTLYIIQKSPLDLLYLPAHLFYLPLPSTTMKFTKFAIAAALSSSAYGSSYSAPSKSAKSASAGADSEIFVMATLVESLVVTLFNEAGIEDDVTEISEDGRRRHHRALEDESSDGEDESSSSGDENNAISKVTFLDVCENNFEDAAVQFQGGMPWTPEQCAAVFDEIDVDPVDDQADGEELEKFYARTLMSLMAGGKRA